MTTAKPVTKTTTTTAKPTTERPTTKSTVKPTSSIRPTTKQQQKPTTKQQKRTTTKQQKRTTTKPTATTTDMDKNVNVTFPCPFRYQAILNKNGQFYLFRSKKVYKISNNRITRLFDFEAIKERLPRRITAAAYNSATDQTFYFSRKRLFRLTHGVRDRSFSKQLPENIRAAVVVNNKLMAFSHKKIYDLNFDGTVIKSNDIQKEFPNIWKAFSSAFTIDDKTIIFLRKGLVIKVDALTKKFTRQRCVNMEGRIV
ncbi:hypothetical protein Ahia01_000739100 [Argonauta hians]